MLSDFTSILLELLLPHEFDAITDYFGLNEPIYLTGEFEQTCGPLFAQINVERGMIVDLEHPSFQILIDEDVKAENLETVTPMFAPAPSRELNFLIHELERLHGEQAFLAYFRYLLK